MLPPCLVQGGQLIYEAVTSKSALLAQLARTCLAAALRLGGRPGSSVRVQPYGGRLGYTMHRVRTQGRFKVAAAIKG